VVCVLCNGSGCDWCARGSDNTTCESVRPPPIRRYGLILWRLAKVGRTTTARTNWHPRGLELRIYSDDVLVRSKVFPPGDEAALEAEADGERVDLLAMGWTPV
jgi:hypothetical protein